MLHNNNKALSCFKMYLQEKKSSIALLWEKNEVHFEMNSGILCKKALLILIPSQ